MTPIWNDEIERTKQDPEASVFLVSFASQNEARATLHKLSFARQITKDGKTGLALPGHIIFKVGKSDEGTLWVLLAGRMSADESLEAYELFGVHGSEQMIVLPNQVESRITGITATPIENASAQEPAKVVSMQAPGKALSAQEPVVAKPAQEPAETRPAPVVAIPPQKPIEVASTQATVAVSKAEEPTVAAPAKEPVKVTPAPEPVVFKATQASPEIILPPVGVKAAQAPAKVAAVQEPAKVVSVQEPAEVSSVQQPVVAKPVQEPTVFKATQAPSEIKPPPVVVKAAQAQAKVAAVPETAKVTTTPVVTAAQPQKEDKRTSPPAAPASDDQAAIRIYLARQGKREGPFTLEHIKAQIAAGRYKDDDFWAWHDGLPEWLPLYKIPGVGKPSSG